MNTANISIVGQKLVPGSFLQEFRELIGIEQATLGEHVGLSQSRISQIEGQREVSHQQAALLLRAMLTIREERRPRIDAMAKRAAQVVGEAT